MKKVEHPHADIARVIPTKIQITYLVNKSSVFLQQSHNPY